MTEAYGNYAAALWRLAGLDASEITDAVWREVCAAQRLDENTQRHWEFLAIALLERCDTNDVLSSETKRRLREIVPLFQAKAFARNFALMKQLVAARLEDRFLQRSDFAAIGLVQTSEGCLLDGPEGPSSQYHAYLLLLIMRWGEPSDVALRQAVQAALKWLAMVSAQYGDPSPLGRGRFQLFGYVSMMRIVTLLDRWNGTLSDEYIRLVAHRLTRETPDGALAACWSGPHRDGLLHSYNTPGDYAAFADFWLPQMSVGKPVVASGGPIWMHCLDFDGSAIFADDAGVFAAMTAPLSPPPFAAGRRKLISDFRRRFFRREKYPEDLAPRACNGEVAKFSSMHLSVARESEGRILRFSYDGDFYGAWHTPIIWARCDDPVVFSADMPVETQKWEWGRGGPVLWMGHSFRAFGRGRIEWIL